MLCRWRLHRGWLTADDQQRAYPPLMIPSCTTYSFVYPQDTIRTLNEKLSMGGLTIKTLTSQMTSMLELMRNDLEKEVSRTVFAALPIYASSSYCNEMLAPAVLRVTARERDLPLSLSSPLPPQTNVAPTVDNHHFVSFSDSSRAGREGPIRRWRGPGRVQGVCPGGSVRPGWDAGHCALPDLQFLCHSADKVLD